MPDSKKVLFVDDDVQPLDLYRRALATLGVSSDLCNRVDSVFDYLDESDYDLLVLDIMPAFPI